MENVLSPYPLLTLELNERLKKLRKYVKESLRKLGYGSNQHLPELGGDIYFEARAKDQYPFLFKIIDFYKSSLDYWEQKYFLNEVLEKGEHYLFWHFDMSARTYYGSEKRALKKIKEELFNDETPF